VGKEIRRQLQRQIELHEAGHVKRADYVERGAKFREGVKQRKIELDGLVASLDMRLSEMETRKTGLETITEVQEAEKQKIKDAEDAEKQIIQDALDAKAAAEAAREQADKEAALAEAAAMGIHAAQDAAGTAAADPVPPQQVEEGQALDTGEEEVDLDEPAGEGEAAAEDEAPVEEESKAEEETKTPEQLSLDALKEEMRPLEEEKTKHTNEGELAVKVLEWDFGPDDAFLALYDKCFSQQVQQYEYELCMFRSTAQKEGGSSQNLGKWGHWNTEAEPYSKMIYDNGGSCWNGPARSMTVSLVCGEDEFLVSVQEPNKCVYEMEFMTPLACNLEAAQRARKELEDMGFPQ